MKACAIVDCPKPAGVPGTARGWCSTHYNRWAKTGDPLVMKSDLTPREPSICQIPGCAKPRWARRMCAMHLMRWRMTGNPGGAEPLWVSPKGQCRIDGCSRPVRVGIRQLCRAHDLRRIKYGDPCAGGVYHNPDARCAVDGCRGDYYGKGWCARHYRVYVDRHAHRRRERMAPGSATPEAIHARMSMFGFRCWMCGADFTDVDHAIPLSRGGSQWPANLRPACHSCNSRKQARDFWRVLAEVKSGAFQAPAKEAIA